jgi:hypothetical protein
MRNTTPPTRRETGATYRVVGYVLLLASLLWGIFVGWDIRGGTADPMTIGFLICVVAGVGFIVVGNIKRRTR